jgi:hypothetical protein
MSSGVFIDTCFLITLANKARANHNAARQYWKYFLTNSIPIHLSTIVAAEFMVKQVIPPAILRACLIHPFNWDDAAYAAKLHSANVHRTGIERDALKDDLKIVAQASTKQAAYFITEDPKLVTALEALKAGGHCPEFKIIQMGSVFDISHFNNGQTELFAPED